MSDDKKASQDDVDNMFSNAPAGASMNLNEIDTVVASHRDRHR